VERVVQAVPGVRDAIAFGKRSSLVGELVACELVVAPDHDAAQVVDAVRRACAAQLLPHEAPRFIRPVPEIALSAAGKKVR
jgi:acyl-coenzyme A synthetase/AMP-(fatty) acid ligase